MLVKEGFTMNLHCPIQSPKNIIRANQIMRSVEKNSIKPLRDIKQRRYKAYLSHSEIGYFPNSRKDSLSKKIKNFFLRLKDEFTFDDLI